MILVTVHPARTVRIPSQALLQHYSKCTFLTEADEDGEHPLYPVARYDRDRVEDATSRAAVSPSGGTGDLQGDRDRNFREVFLRTSEGILDPRLYHASTEALRLRWLLLWIVVFWIEPMEGQRLQTFVSYLLGHSLRK